MIGPDEVVEILGGPPCRFGGHPNAAMWMTRTFVCCPCGISYGRRYYPEIEAAVVAVRPKQHCNEWGPGDPEDRFHARRCEFKGLRLVTP